MGSLGFGKLLFKVSQKKPYVSLYFVYMIKQSVTSLVGALRPCADNDLQKAEENILTDIAGFTPAFIPQAARNWRTGCVLASNNKKIFLFAKDIVCHDVA